MTVADTLRRDVGQLLWIGIRGPELDADAARILRGGDAGVVVLFRRNLSVTHESVTLDLLGGPSLVERAMAGQLGPERLPAAAATRETIDIDVLIALCRAIRDAAPPAADPVAIAVDQEGGRVQRIRAPATMWPPMLQFDRVERAAVRGLAEAIGRAMGDELAQVGFDFDFAPVLDVHTNADNPIIGDRAFATQPADAAERALAFARGLEAAGVAACGKHYPGHGDTRTDSHLELPRLGHAMDRLRAVELVPFGRAAQARLPMIMTAHVVFDALDPAIPATMSRRAITDLLRGELGYRGVIVSDDMDMRAIADNFGIPDASVRAVMAGCDALLLCCNEDNQLAAREALLRAGTDRAEVRARIAAAAAQVRALKRAYVARRRALDRERALAVLGRPEHRQLAGRLASA